MESHGIFCLSTDPRNILMWSHYGQHHKGIALQFEYARDPVNFSYVLPINYSNRYPAINYFAGREDYSTLVLRKYCDWAYEKEWRLVKNENAETYHSFCHEALTGVILGCSANGPIVDRIREMIAERERIGLGRIKIYRANQHESEYKLDISSDRSIRT